MKRSRPRCVLLVIGTLAGAGVHAWAQTLDAQPSPPESQPAPTPADPDLQAESYRLFAEGKAAYEAGEFERAAGLFQQAADVFDRVPNAVAAAAMYDWMGDCNQALHRRDEAIARKAESVRRMRDALGDEHPYTLTSINNMGYPLKHLVAWWDCTALKSSSICTSRRVSCASIQGIVRAAFSLSPG